MTPTDKDAAQSVRSGRGLPPDYPRFQPIVYSLENTFPLVKLGQADKWQPDPKSEKQPLRNKRFFGWICSPWFLRVFIWIQILLGWLFATLFLAVVSGIVQHS